MVCPLNEDYSPCTIYDSTQQSDSSKNVSLKCYPHTTVKSIFDIVAHDLQYNQEDIQLYLESKDGVSYYLNDHKEETLQDVGVPCNPDHSYQILVDATKFNKSVFYEDELLLGASASPTTGDMMMMNSAETQQPTPALTYEPYSSHSSRNSLKPIAVESCNYVGLVNQAMTCYLNSLLQALYMTPEFRNALYNWEFDGQNENRSIPYQLQKLFLNLQTSSKSAVETTDLTTSFGWQGSDAWHQHDIQELCRVMFDALEQKFKDTKQANLINDLYEGKMLDYVKCLECGTESSREDTFQDIPLPVRPFGSTVAYNSVEEALQAFVQPETLDGNNQYHCEKCTKKCDAHKGLKFTKFPYLLTLHLKRFDFDYNTLHRIKLNDKVVFPEMLNLNSFIPTKHEHEHLDEREPIVKCDDCSTTDSGAADDESCQGTDISSTVNGPDDNCADSDEGIDVSSGTNHELDPKGPYMYELFSIMIHSGSASGGHYYAYIKDFDKNRWFCFNDQSVSAITEDDIRKTYGGGPQRGYYSGAYSSSTNAYMLMYRQIDKERNCRTIDLESFPPHIKKLLTQMRKKEEEDRINREKENDMIKLYVFCTNPETNVTEDVKINMYTDSTLKEAAYQAHYRFKLIGVVAVEDCRIVIYNKKQECIKCSYENDDIKFCDINCTDLVSTDWMLEIKKPNEEFKVYKNGGINMKVFPVRWETEEVDEPSLVRVDIDDTIKDLRNKVVEQLGLEDEPFKLVLYSFNDDPLVLEEDDELVKFDDKNIDYKLFVTIGGDEDEKALLQSKLDNLIERFGYLLTLNIALPETDVATLETLSIPSLDLNQNLDKLLLTNGDHGTSSPGLRVSPQPSGGMCGDGFGDQSNSEDSSLSDSDRTLVGDAPGECLGVLSSSSTSPADQHMASPTDPAEDNYNHDVFNNPSENPTEEMNWDDGDTQDNKYDNEYQKPQNYYFKFTQIRYYNDDEKDPAGAKFTKLLADKRMTLKRLKQQLEPIVRVPMSYFKVFRQFGNTEDEWSTLTDTLRLVKDGEKLNVKLGRVLRKDEFNTKIYHLKLDNCEPSNFLFDHIIAKGQTVGQAKKEILLQAKKQHMLDIPFNKCRLRDKSWKKAHKVHLDSQKFSDDVLFNNNMELYLQELPDGEPVTSATQMVLFVRKWCPSTLKLEPVREIVLNGTLIEELKSAISAVSNIPVENVDFAHVKYALPCDMHVLEISDELSWNPNMVTLDQWPLNADDGSVFFYRDNRESLKELKPEERKEINNRENARLGRHSTKSPGREKALKIYLDTSPCKYDSTSRIE